MDLVYLSKQLIGIKMGILVFRSGGHLRFFLFLLLVWVGIAAIGDKLGLSDVLVFSEEFSTGTFEDFFVGLSVLWIFFLPTTITNFWYWIFFKLLGIKTPKIFKD